VGGSAGVGEGLGPRDAPCVRHSRQVRGRDAQGRGRTCNHSSAGAARSSRLTAPDASATTTCLKPGLYAAAVMSAECTRMRSRSWKPGGSLTRVQALADAGPTDSKWTRSAARGWSLNW
jgi:hypothetical protein